MSFNIVILSVSPWYNVSRTFMTLTFDLNFKIIYFNHEFESGKMSLLFEIGFWNFGIWVYHHETTCCAHSLPKYDLDFWPICGWRRVSLESFTHSFYHVGFFFLICKAFPVECLSGVYLSDCLFYRTDTSVWIQLSVQLSVHMSVCLSVILL